MCHGNCRAMAPATTRDSKSLAYFVGAENVCSICGDEFLYYSALDVLSTVVGAPALGGGRMLSLSTANNQRSVCTCGLAFADGRGDASRAPSGVVARRIT